MVEEVERESKTWQQWDVSITNEKPKTKTIPVNWKSPGLDFVLEGLAKEFRDHLHTSFNHA